MKIIKSKKIQATALILFAIVFEIVLSIIYYCNSSIPFLETLYYSSQIISSIFVISGVVIAVWQYYLSSKSAKTDLEIVQVQRAIDLSEYYKDNILKYFPAIYYVFNNTGASEIINSIHIEQLKDFDFHELNRLFTPTQIQQLKNLQESEDFAKRILEANAIYNLGFGKNNIKTILTKDGEQQQALVLKGNGVILSFFSRLIDDLLNNMEFFALHFSHNTADESVIYQSLHQTYLQIVHYMYYDIAIKNTESTSKYYTNIIWLFQEWHLKKQRQTEELSLKSNSIQSSGTIITK